jgi:hypothetical protein
VGPHSTRFERFKEWSKKPIYSKNQFTRNRGVPKKQFWYQKKTFGAKNFILVPKLILVMKKKSWS